MVKIGLVLSGGGARGFAEIGALKVLKKYKINVSRISGSSVGALIGACYAHNPDPAAIEQLLLKIKNNRDVYDYAFSTKGLIKGDKLEQYIIEFFAYDKKKPIRFEDLKTPVLINATDLVNQKEIVFDKGPLIPAIMASISYPGFFTTRQVGKDICVDGGIVNPLPFDLLTNVDYLIMIDVSRQHVKIDADSNFKDIVLQATWTMQKSITEKSLRTCKTPYTIIMPDVNYHGVLEFGELTELIKKGEQEAEKHIRKIRRDINRLESQKNDAKKRIRK